MAPATDAAWSLLSSPCMDDQIVSQDQNGQLAALPFQQSMRHHPGRFAEWWGHSNHGRPPVKRPPSMKKSHSAAISICRTKEEIFTNDGRNGEALVLCILEKVEDIISHNHTSLTCKYVFDTHRCSLTRRIDMWICQIDSSRLGSGLRQFETNAIEEEVWKVMFSSQLKRKGTNVDGGGAVRRGGMDGKNWIAREVRSIYTDL